MVQIYDSGKSILMTRGEVQEGAKEMIGMLEDFGRSFEINVITWEVKILNSWILEFFSITAGSFPMINHGEIPEISISWISKMK
uniref:Uncharacterized protein n=1 Tax=Salix viminalis TaxID=40686 RepID=A0A6N2KIG3_SALVM